MQIETYITSILNVNPSRFSNEEHTLIRLYFQEKKTISEIAIITGKGIECIKSVIQKFRFLMKKEMSEVEYLKGNEILYSK